MVQTDAVMGKVPHKALRLRVASAIRCPLRVPKEARLRTALGLLGVGEADAEISVRVDGKAPVSLLKKTIKGGDGQAWEDVDVSLDAFAGQLVEIELAVVRGATPGRLLFGDPEVVVPTAQPEDTKRAQVVVLVVLAGVDRDELPLYSTRQAVLERSASWPKVNRSCIIPRARRGPEQLATLSAGCPEAAPCTITLALRRAAHFSRGA